MPGRRPSGRVGARFRSGFLATGRGRSSRSSFRKHQRHFDGFDDKILSMYARGMTTRDIRDHLQEIYGVKVSPDLISRVTDAVLDELRTWQHRPLEPVYLIVYLDALVVKIRHKGLVQNRAVYVAVGVGRRWTQGRPRALDSDE